MTENRKENHLTKATTVQQSRGNHDTDSDVIAVIADSPDALSKLYEDCVNRSRSETVALVRSESEKGFCVLRTVGHIPLDSRTPLRYDRLPLVLSRYVDQVYLFYSPEYRQGFSYILRGCADRDVTTYVPYDDSDPFLTDETDIDGVVKVAIPPLTPKQEALKRLFDVLFVTPLFLLGIPVMCLIGIAIYLECPGSIFYKQQRTKRFGETFSIWKFRTMVPNAESSTGPTLSSNSDPRVTNVGRVLRETHFDELPQLLQILSGKMSFVGPRPERPEIERDLDIEEWPQRWFVKPGAAGKAQTEGLTGNEPERRLEADVHFIEQYSTKSYLVIATRQIVQWARTLPY